MAIEFQPIGVIHSPHQKLDGMPIQPAAAAGIPGTVEVYPDYKEGLQDLDGFSHIILLYHFHRSQGYRLQVVPYLDTQQRGLFATRAPRRPNPIGLSVVALKGIAGNILQIENVDILDGTPLLDIKPYFPEFVDPETLRTGWLANARRNMSDQKSDDRFA
jgi:tRNA-Thr(GGU) m(6)t(6)A37 methyltransferase TsaA